MLPGWTRQSPARPVPCTVLGVPVAPGGQPHLRLGLGLDAPSTAKPACALLCPCLAGLVRSFRATLWPSLWPHVARRGPGPLLVRRRAAPLQQRGEPGAARCRPAAAGPPLSPSRLGLCAGLALPFLSAQLCAVCAAADRPRAVFLAVASFSSLYQSSCQAKLHRSISWAGIRTSL